MVSELTNSMTTLLTDTEFGTEVSEASTSPTKRARMADEDDSSTPSNYNHTLSSSGWNGLLKARQNFLDSLEVLRQEVEATQSAAFDEVYASARVWQLREDLLLGTH